MSLRLLAPVSEVVPHDPPVTADSIAAAQAQQRLDRLRVYADTGIQIDTDGHFLLPTHLDLGLALGNMIAAACYGARGEKR